jgi:hypothetical protein
VYPYISNRNIFKPKIFYKKMSNILLFYWGWVAKITYYCNITKICSLFANKTNLRWCVPRCQTIIKKNTYINLFRIFYSMSKNLFLSPLTFWIPLLLQYSVIQHFCFHYHLIFYFIFKSKKKKNSKIIPWHWL